MSLLPSSLHAALALVFCGAGITSSLVAQTPAAATPTGERLLSERFQPGRRLVAKLPETAAWYCSSGNGIHNQQAGLTVSANRHLLAYFRPDQAPLELKPGQTLRAEFRFSVSDPVASNTTMRFALLYSGGNARRVTADNVGLANPLFAGYTGYGAFLNLGRSTAVSFFQRDDNVTPATGKLIHGNDDYAALAINLGTGADLAPDTAYTGRFDLTRTAQGLRIAFSIAELPGYTAEYTDTVSPYLRFDTVVLFGSPSGMSRYKVESVDLTLLPASAR